MSNVFTLTGTKRTTPGSGARPTLRLCGEPAALEARQLVPINDCLIRLEAEMRRLLSLLGGDQDEWMDNVEAVTRKVRGHD